jgi:hypothetical protein
MSGSKQKLSITQWSVKNKKVVGDPFSVMLNPAGYSRTRQILFAEDYPDAAAMAKAKLKGNTAEGLTLEEMVFDGTGVVGEQTSAPLSVDQQISKLRKVLFDADPSDSVERPVVQLVWGNLYFLGRLNNIKVQYTLFKPNGLALRARVTLAFREFEEEYAKPAAKADKAMTQQLAITAELNLPLLCFKTYQDPAMVQAVARVNDLTSFRNIPNGQVLVCPPK